MLPPENSRYSRQCCWCKLEVIPILSVHAFFQNFLYASSHISSHFFGGRIRKIFGRSIGRILRRSINRKERNNFQFTPTTLSAIAAIFWSKYLSMLSLLQPFCYNLILPIVLCFTFVHDYFSSKSTQWI